MLNYIDKKFYSLVNEIKSHSEDDIYKHMVNKFLSLPFITQISIQQFLNKFEYWGRLEVENKKFDMLKNKAKVFYDNAEDYIWLYENLKDYKSKYILFAIINNFYNFDFIALKHCMENIYKHYFDLEILPERKNDIYVDVGAFVGDSCIDYIESFSETAYCKIYCYEIDNENVDKMSKNLINYKNIKIIEKAVSDTNADLYYDLNEDSSANRITNNGSKLVKAVCLDDDIKEKITMVKMDIEGGEKRALKGMMNHIKNDNPTLLISVYHNNTDLLKIPKMILNYNENYNLYLRYYGGCYFATEIVLIAVPNSYD